MTIYGQEVQSRRIGMGVVLGVIIVVSLALTGCAKAGYIRVESPLGSAGVGTQGRQTIVVTNAMPGIEMYVRVSGREYCAKMQTLETCVIPLGTNWSNSSKLVALTVVGVKPDGTSAGVLDKNISIPRFTHTVQTRDIPVTIRSLR